MKFKEITVHKIASTEIHRVAIAKWLTEVGGVEVSDEVFKQLEEQNLSDAETLIGLAGKRCYNSFVPGLNPNVKKVRESWADYLTNILKSGHGSVLEHATWTYAIENCTRVMTAEGNRHRAGVAISEASMRYIRFEDEGINAWLPFSIRANSADDSKLAGQKTVTRMVFEKVFKFVESEYRYLAKTIWDVDNLENFAQKKAITSLLRRLVPMGVCTGVIYTFNLRALRHVFTMRCSPSAEEEIVFAFGRIAHQIIGEEQKLCGDFESVELANGLSGYIPKYVKV